MSGLSTLQNNVAEALGFLRMFWLKNRSSSRQARGTLFASLFYVLLNTISLFQVVRSAMMAPVLMATYCLCWVVALTVNSVPQLQVKHAPLHLAIYQTK